MKGLLASRVVCFLRIHQSDGSNYSPFLVRDTTVLAFLATVYELNIVYVKFWSSGF